MLLTNTLAYVLGLFVRSLYWTASPYAADKWKRISHKQSTRWQHLSWFKDSAFFSFQKNVLVVKKHNNLYMGLVMPSSG